MCTYVYVYSDVYEYRLPVCVSVYVGDYWHRHMYLNLGPNPETSSLTLEIRALAVGEAGDGAPVEPPVPP